MLIARPELAPKRETLFPANDQKVTPLQQQSAGCFPLDVLRNRSSGSRAVLVWACGVLCARGSAGERRAFR